MVDMPSCASELIAAVNRRVSPAVCSPSTLSGEPDSCQCSVRSGPDHAATDIAKLVRSADVRIADRTQPMRLTAG